jgi:hypothetical protein
MLTAATKKYLMTHGVLPVGEHHCTLLEIYNLYAKQMPNAAHRKALFKGFIDWMNSLIKYDITECRLLFDGSYTSTKELPNDIDIAILVGRNDVHRLKIIPEYAKLFRTTDNALYSPKHFGCDAYLGHYSHQAQWNETFMNLCKSDMVRLNVTKKGLIVVDLRLRRRL